MKTFLKRCLFLALAIIAFPAIVKGNFFAAVLLIPFCISLEKKQ